MIVVDSINKLMIDVDSRVPRGGRMVGMDLGMLVQQPLGVEDSGTSRIETHQAKTTNEVIAGATRCSGVPGDQI